MKIDNLKEVLEYAKIDALPEKNNDAKFKLAIGTVKTTAVEESYCILKMLDEKPEVKKMFVGGMKRLDTRKMRVSRIKPLPVISGGIRR